ncbi:hypothetical protein Tco_0141386, partial [Tanacetum coccineum]
FLALGWILEKIHMTWAHLEKKQTRLRLYTKNHEELFTQSLETASQPESDGVMTFMVTASEIQRRRQDVVDLKGSRTIYVAMALGVQSDTVAAISL